MRGGIAIRGNEAFLGGSSEDVAAAEVVRGGSALSSFSGGGGGEWTLMRGPFSEMLGSEGSEGLRPPPVRWRANDVSESIESWGESGSFESFESPRLGND